MVTRDTLKTSANLPLIGTVSLGGLLIIGAAFFILGYRRKKNVTVRV